MKPKNQNPFLIAALTLAGFALAASSALAATQYYKSTTAANAWTGSFWGSSGAEPFTSAWVSGSDADFVDNGGIALALTGATTQFASITANESVTLTAAGTLGTGGTVASVTVASGKTLNFQGQALSTAAGTGFIKNGPGIWSLNGSAYLGGFTLNAGTVAVGGINAMGAGGTLTINGGTIRSTATAARDLSGKYTSITIGGDFTLGDAVNNGALTFATTAVNLGAANRIITLNSAATFGTSAVISGDAGVGFTKTGTGTLTLQGANTFSGGVTILSGTVDSKTTQTTLGSGTLVIGGTGGVNPIFQTGVNNTNAVQINANTAGTGTSIIAANGTGSGFTMSGPITLNGANLNVRTFGSGTTAAVTLSGGVTGTGNLTINNLSNGVAATGKVTLNGATIDNVGTVTSQGNGPTANVISAVIGANVTGVVVPNTTTTPLNLTAANLYTGPTTIGTGGTLVLGHANAASNSSSVTIADTGALSLTTTPSTVKTLTFSATGKLNFDVAASGTGLTVSTLNGVTNSGAAGSVTINITGSAPANGTYPLISYSGTLQGSGFGAYVLGTTPPGKSYALNDATGVVQLVVSDLPAMNWTGVQSTEWSTAAIAGSKNWNLGGSPLDYTDGQAVLFDGTATSYTVDLSVADVTPSNVSFDNNGATPYTLQGSKAITGSTALTKAGSQTLTILNSNTYTGATIISAGKLEIGGASLLGALGTYAGAITIASGATFEKSSGGTQTLSGAVTGGGTLKMSGNGGVTLNNSGNGYGALDITVGRVFISTSALALPTAATVSITNNGLLVFNTSGTYNSAITVGDNGGICSRNSSGATFSNVTLPGTGTVIFNNDDSATRLLTISKGQTLTGDLTVQISGNRMATTTTQLGAATLSGVLAGSGGLTLASSGNPLNASLYGTGTLTLTGANNYTGPTTIKSGKLVLDTAANRLATTAAVALGDVGTTAKLALGGTTAASQTLTALTTTGLGGSVVGGNSSNSTLLLNIATSNTFGGTLGGVGTNENNLALTKQGAGTLTLSNAANTFTGQVLSDSGTIQVTKLENNGTASSVGSGTGSLRLGSDATATLEYIGTTDSSTNKVIQIGTNVATNTGSAAILNNSSSGKLTFTATSFNQVVGAATVARALILGGSHTGAANEITGIIQDHNTGGGGIVSLTKEGASTWALSGANTYTGDTTVNSGVLAVNGTSIANNGKLVIAGGMVDLTNTETVYTLFFGAAQQPSGTYSSSSVPAGATITTASFSGGGTLTVTSGPGGTYASWIDSFLPGETNPAIIGTGADPDNDGINNGVEMVIGGNPATGMDTALLPTIELVTNPVGTPAIPAGDYLLFTYRRSDLSVAAGVTATCETDSDLVAPWTVATDGVSGTVIQVDDNFIFTPPAAANTDRVRVYVPRGANTKLFGRLDVQVP